MTSCSFLLSIRSPSKALASIQFLWGRNNPNVKFLRQESHGEDRQEEAEAQKQGQHQNHHKTGLRSCTLDDAKNLILEFVKKISQSASIEYGSVIFRKKETNQPTRRTDVRAHREVECFNC